MAAPRAAYVTFNEQYGCLEVAYDENPEGLKEVSAKLKGVRGISYTNPIPREGGGSGILIRFGVPNTDTVLAALKKVINPRLPVSVYMLSVSVVRCRNDVHTNVTCAPAFVPGFAPENKDTFANQLHVGLLRLNVGDLFPLVGNPLPDLFIKAVKALFERLGACVGQAELEFRFCC